MNNTLLKYLTILLLTLFSKTLFSQENKFELSIEYSPNYSRLTNEVVNEKFKLSHNVLLRITYNTKGRIKPTLGLGYLNTGELENSEIGGQLGIESVKFIHNYNYLYIPIGAIVNISNMYLIPEIGFGINISNRSKQITEFTNGETEKETRDAQLNSGEFNDLTIPLSLSIGTNFKVGDKVFSTGVKGYYGLNQVVRDVPRKNHYFGIGLILAINL